MINKAGLEKPESSHPLFRASDIRTFRISPRHFQKKETLTTTRNMLLGTIVHLYLLENEKVSQKLIEQPEFLKKTKDQPLTIKEQKELFEKENMDKIIIDPSMKETIDKILDSFKSASLEVQNIFNSPGRVVETTIYGEHEDFTLQGTPDLVMPDKGIIVDLKTSLSSSPDSFSKSIAQYEYMIQAAAYRMLCEKLYNRSFDHFLFVVVETQSPYNITPLILSRDMLELGRKLIEKTIPEMITAVKANKFRGYTSEIEEISIPEYAKYRYYREGVYDGV